MNKILSAFSIAILTVASVSAQPLKPNFMTDDPITGLAPQQWEEMVARVLDTRAIVGEGMVVISSMMQVLAEVNCDGKQLATDIKPFSVTFIKSHAPCKGEVAGRTNNGLQVVGHLSSDATIIVFKHL